MGNLPIACVRKVTYFPFLLKVKLIYSHVRESSVLVSDDNWALTDGPHVASIAPRQEPPPSRWAARGLGCFRLSDWDQVEVWRLMGLTAPPHTSLMASSLQPRPSRPPFVHWPPESLGSNPASLAAVLPAPDLDAALSCCCLSTCKVIISDPHTEYFPALFFFPLPPGDYSWEQRSPPGHLFSLITLES